MHYTYSCPELTCHFTVKADKDIEAKAHAVKHCGGGPRCKQAGHVPAAAKLIEFKQIHLLKSFFFILCSLRFDIIENYV